MVVYGNIFYNTSSWIRLPYPPEEGTARTVAAAGTATLPGELPALGPQRRTGLSRELRRPLSDDAGLAPETALRAGCGGAGDASRGVEVETSEKGLFENAWVSLPWFG